MIGLVFVVGFASAQSGALAKDAGSDLALKSSSTRLVLSTTETTAEVSALRTIDDPPTGHRWLLMRDAEHPGGPGKLVLSTEAPPSVGASGVVSGAGGSMALRPTLSTSAKALVSGGAAQPQIRSGDRLLVEEHSQVADVQLMAVALGPAMIGSVFKARLEIGGKVVSVVAVGPGRASFAAGTETHP
jgi:hypothetical protein